MNKLLTLMVFIVSVSLLVTGCSKGSETNSNLDTGVSSDAAKDTVSGTDVPTDTSDTNITDDEVIVTESKTQVEKNDETLATVIVDGTYVENENYMSPGGLDTIEITLSVKDDIVTDVSIKSVVADPKSLNYITKVNAALPDLVIGKSISEIQNLPKQISGSSLTTAAFKKQAEQFIANNPA